MWVMNQAFRIAIHKLMTETLTRIRARGDVEVVLIEPDPTDAMLFMYNPASFAARRKILEHGYHTARAKRTTWFEAGTPSELFSRRRGETDPPSLTGLLGERPGRREALAPRPTVRLPFGHFSGQTPESIMTSTLITTLLLAVLYLLIVRFVDMNEKEPLWAMLLLFVLGAGGAVLVTLGLSRVLLDLRPGRRRRPSELVKFMAIGAGVGVLVAYGQRRGWEEFNGTMDGIVYGTCAGLGFGVAEQAIHQLTHADDGDRHSRHAGRRVHRASASKRSPGSPMGSSVPSSVRASALLRE